MLRNAAKCGAAGAAVNGANGLRRNRKNRNLGQDAAVGAGASAATRAVLGGEKIQQVIYSMVQLRVQLSISSPNRK